MAQTTEAASTAAGGGDNLLRAMWRQALIAAALAAGAALLARFILQITTPAEVYAEALIRFVPLSVFSWLVGTLGPSAKHLFFGTVLIGAGMLAAALPICNPPRSRGASHVPPMPTSALNTP